MKIPIIFLGTGSYVLPILETLQKKFDLKLVVTTEKNPTDSVPAYCKKQGISFLSVSKLDSAICHKLSDINAPIAVLASFGLIIPQDFLDIFPKGIINIHPSYLPYYRGSTPIQAAIKNGDKETAVSIMLLDQAVDHGPILAQIPLEITPDDTAESLYAKAFTLGAEKLVDIIPAYIAGNVEPREQDHAKATYTEPLTRNSGYIDLDQTKKMSPLEIARLVRAYFPWPGVWTKVRIKNQEVRIKNYQGLSIEQ